MNYLILICILSTCSVLNHVVLMDERVQYRQGPYPSIFFRVDHIRLFRENLYSRLPFKQQFAKL